MQERPLGITHPTHGLLNGIEVILGMRISNKEYLENILNRWNNVLIYRI